MTKQFDFFTYVNKDIRSFDLIGVDFDNDNTIPMGLSREIVKGESNSYRRIANHYGTKYSNSLEFQIHLAKNPATHTSQSEMSFSENDVRLINRWLTSSTLPQWINITYQNNSERYKGVFSDIETVCAGDDVIGLKYTFTCNGQFAYTEDIVNSKDVAGYSNISIVNDSDELENYVYPEIKITATATGDVFMFNETDSNILKTGILSILDGNTAKMTYLLSEINTYATLHGYEVEFKMDENTNDLKCIIGNTGVEFKYIDKFGSVMECIGYFDSSDNFMIFEGGFMYLHVLADNPITIDCEKYKLYDSLNREILLSDIGLDDIDEMYWMRYLNGTNNIRLFADNANFTFTHKEERKIGAM